MELRHLRYFLAVARELHFTRAAEQLGIGQPPLSQQIQQLEREIGVKLFIRDRRGVALTEAGTAFREEAIRVITGAEQAIETARRIGQGEIALLNIGFTVSASIHPFVPRVIRSCRERLPQVHINLVERTTNELVENVRDGHVDLAFIRSPAPDVTGVQIDTLLNEPLVAVLPNIHRLAARTTIALRELAGEPFIFYPRKVGTGIYNSVVQACENCGFTPQIQVEVPQMTSLVTFVAAGLGVSLVPSTMQQLQAEGVCYIPLSDKAVPQAHLAIAYRTREPTMALSYVISGIREAAAVYGAPDTSIRSKSS